MAKRRASNDLFAPLDEAKRQQLRDAGWEEVKKQGGGSDWRRPDGVVVPESVAFACLPCG